MLIELHIALKIGLFSKFKQLNDTTLSMCYFCSIGVTYMANPKTILAFKKSEHQNLLEYVKKYCDITYINTKYF